MSKRKIEDESEARRCLLTIEREGWDIRTWARAHGVDGRSLHAWRVNLDRWGGRKAEQRELEPAAAAMAKGLVELVPARPVRNASSRSEVGRYVLAIGDACVEFGDDFSEPTLRRIIGVLRSC